MLEDSKELEHAYAKAARHGSTEPPASAEAEVGYHYIAFVKSQHDNHIYQLDGDRSQPIDVGHVAEDDVLAPICLDVIRRMMSEDENVNFSLMALVEGRFM